jgi:hypothetical protein
MNDQKHIADRIDWYIEEVFYYLKYPDGVEEGIWKDRDGKHRFMSSMNLNYLQACVKTIERDKTRFDKQKVKDEVYYSVRAALFPLLDRKLEELRSELRNRIEES